MREARFPPSDTSSRAATAWGVLAIILWSTTIACSRSVAEQLGVFTGAAVVYLAAGVAGCGVLAARGQLVASLRQAGRRYLIGCGVLMVAYTVLLYVAVGFAVTRAQVVTVTVANYLWPSLTLLLAVPILGWRARPLGLAAGTLAGVAGVALAVGADRLGAEAGGSWTAHATSTLPALLAAVAWGLYSNLSRRWGGPQAANAMPLFLLASGLVLAALRACRAEHSVWSARVVTEAGYLAAFPTLLAYVCWDTAARRGNLSLVAALSYLTPLLSVLVSSLYLDLPVPPQQWLAGVLVVAGAVLCKLSVRTESAQAGQAVIARTCDDDYIRTR
ncbi:MAG: EamA family transporter [Candidatus Anammoximicrobium sp.]|nr:EamA family transporter [Candidatus Anammoximicrobium sp.]